MVPEDSDTAEETRPAPGTSRSMKSNRGRDTSFELRVRSEVHKRGLRYRVNTRPLADFRRTADLVFRSRKIAVMLDGCFWHRCPEHATSPATNASWWSEKFARTIERDAETNRVLAENGWQVLRFWEHDSVHAIADEIERAVIAADHGS